MARICIPDHEYKERVQRCAAILRREKLDALIVNGNEATTQPPLFLRLLASVRTRGRGHLRRRRRCP